MIAAMILIVLAFVGITIGVLAWGVDPQEGGLQDAEALVLALLWPWFFVRWLKRDFKTTYSRVIRKVERGDSW